MKKILYTLLLCLSLGFSASAQRLIPYQPTMELGLGLPLTIDESYTLTRNYKVYGAFNYYLKHADYTFALIDYELQNYPYKLYDVPVRDFTLNLGYMYPLLYDNGRNVLLYAGASILSGYESLNDEQAKLPNGAILLDKSAFIYGGALSSSIEVFLSDNTLLSLKIDTRLCLGTKLNKFRPACTLGLRLNL